MPTPTFCPEELIQALSQTISPAALEAALDRTGKRERRTRKLPSTLILQLVITLGLLVEVARRQVLGYLLPKGALLPTKKSISRACYRVGPRPMMALFLELAKPLADEATLPQAFHHGLRLVALDGSKLDVPDTPENDRIFGRHATGRGRSAFPQVKLIGLAEVGTHALLDLRLRPHQRHETAPALQIVRRSVQPGMLVLFDRGLYSYRMLATITSQGAEFLGRVPAQATLEAGKRLSDGSYLSRVYPTQYARRKERGGVAVRVIEYRVGEQDEVVRLVTSLLDHKAHPALELATLYHERWEFELLLDEVKTHQQGRPNGQQVAVHAQAPAGVIQEIYGLALAHRVVRALMAGAAAREGIDPDRLSFKNALVIVRRYLPELAQARPSRLPPLWPAS
jgi:hypothetical protein